MNRLNQIIKGKEQEANDQRIKVNQLESSMNEYKNIQQALKDNQNKIALMTQEIDRLNNLIKNKNSDIDDLEREKIELYSMVNKYKNYETKIQENEQVVNRLQKSLADLKKDMDNSQDKIRSLDNKNKELENNLYQQSQ